MKKCFLVILVLFLVFFEGIGQVEISTKVVDYGTIDNKSSRLVDLTITNLGTSKTFILRTDFGPEFKLLFSSDNRSIEAGESIVLRVRFDPRKEGSFKIKNEIWFSTEPKPIDITFKGEVDYVMNSYNTPCPDFDNPSTGSSASNDLEILVTNLYTGDEIKDARVRIVEQGRVQKTLHTNNKGVSKLKNIPISYYYLIIDANQYKYNDTALYINQRTPNLAIALEPIDEEDAQNEIGVEEVKDEEILMPVVEEVELIPAEDFLHQESQEEIIDGELNEELFKKNNIVFLIDISQSMNQKGKLDLLKNAMLALVDVLREDDYVTIITYATHPKILLPTTSGIDKEKTKSVISGLKAGGSTSGSKGFKMAYDEVLKNLLLDGNNQVIVATDGLFKEEDNPKIIKLVKKHHGKNITTSMVGVKSHDKTSAKLAEIALLGDGSFVFIDNYDADQAKLIEEIKKQSKR